MIGLAGRLHPVLVHFPVALIVTAGVAEGVFVASRDRRAETVARVLILVGAWVSIPAVLTGMAAASRHTFEPAELATFSIHRIVALVLPVICFLATALAASSRHTGQIWELWLYRVFLAIAVALALVAGWTGGWIAHGPLLTILLPAR